MGIGSKILTLRKKANITQEELAEKLGVTRQTISKWELEETAPDIKQAKELSKTFHISLDELVDNNVKELLVEKVSNTEKLVGIIIKILKVIGILFVVFLIIDIIAFILFTSTGKLPDVESSITTVCSIDDKNYTIEFGADKYFKCDDCSDRMRNDLRKLIDFNHMEKSMDKIEEYFVNYHGSCD